MSRARVALVRCQAYDGPQVQRSIEEGIELLGMHMRFKVKKILVKPNCLSPKSPSLCVTTHPSVVGAVVRIFKRLCEEITVADQPGAAHGEKALQTSGMKRAGDEEGVRVTTFDKEGYERVELDGLLKDGYFAKTYLQSDFVVSLPKLKTHVQTKFTGAVKNVFGAVPLKTRRLAHSLAELLSEAVVDIYSFSPPALHIMDAVWAMEGDGPSQGKPRHLGLVLLSEDAVALDAVASYLIGFEPMEIPTTRIAHERGLGVGNLREIDMMGEDPDAHRKRFKPPTSFFMKNAKLLSWLLYSVSSVKPKFYRRHCDRCEGCVDVCSVDAISMNPYPLIDYVKCIECFSCAEVCGQDAIKPKRMFHLPLLGRSAGG
jgi:uncharacterized protein (DUF362 family)/NAD-dependent dihydropyrimidine dehydrogenase PreA subunit